MNSNNARIFNATDGMATAEPPRVLHGTLPLEDLIGLFADEIAELVVYDSFEYENRQHAIHVLLGKPTLHKCQYKLNINDMEFGQLTLTRKTPFSDGEINQLEAALGALVIQLNNAMAFPQALPASELYSVN